MAAPLPDVAAFVDVLASLADSPPAELAPAASLFDTTRPVAVARAPGRLDVMGGIADYSGSLVLQMPTSEATLAAVQMRPSTAETPARIRAISLGGGATGRAPVFDAAVADLFTDDGQPTPLTELATKVGATGATSWAAYVVGVLGVLAHEADTREAIRASGGFSILVSSQVPEGKGVSSSAAVEVATMMGVLGALEVSLSPPERIAMLCQRVENFVVGAPCGIMDQMASALGHEGKVCACSHCSSMDIDSNPHIGWAVILRSSSGMPPLLLHACSAGMFAGSVHANSRAPHVRRLVHRLVRRVTNRTSTGGANRSGMTCLHRLSCEQLLPLLCQPHTVESPLVTIPSHLRFWGVDSGVRHSVGGSDYGTVRAATFMARTVLRSLLTARAATASEDPPTVLPSDITALTHLVHMSPSLYAELSDGLPETVSGQTFLDRWGTHGDGGVTTVEPTTTYPLRACAAHPISEHHRVGSFRELLAASPSEAQLVLLGELMYQSHSSYSAVGLGSDATDRIVMLVRSLHTSLGSPPLLTSLGDTWQVRSLGPASGLYGAKITGGGSGGTVCVLGSATPQAEASLQTVLSAYAKLSGHTPHVFSGSSVGAVAFGHVSVDLRRGAEQLTLAAGKAGADGGGKGKRKSRR